MRTASHAPGRPPGMLRSTSAAAAGAAATAVLGRTAATWAARDAQAFMTSGELPVDGLVALLAVGAGTLAAAVLTAGCTLLAAASVARLVGRSLRTTARAARLALAIGRRLDRAGSRLTPLVLRRALAIGIGAGLGLAGPAAVATADEADLGWAVTSTPAPDAVPAPTTPEAERPADVPATDPPAAEVSTDAGWRAWPVSGGTTQVTSPPPSTDPTALPSPGPDVTGTSPQDVSPTAATAPEPADAGTVPGAGGGQAAPAAPPPPAPAPVDGVVVQPGDSLWSIAETALGPAASDARIAEAWPRWYAANRALIGADPSLIHPGQELTVPREALAGAPLEETP